MNTSVHVSTVVDIPLLLVSRFIALCYLSLGGVFHSFSPLHNLTSSVSALGPEPLLNILLHVSVLCTTTLLHRTETVYHIAEIAPPHISSWFLSRCPQTL